MGIFQMGQNVGESDPLIWLGEKWAVVGESSLKYYMVQKEIKAYITASIFL